MQKLGLILFVTAVSCARVQDPIENWSERVGNFSIEVLYHTSLTLQEEQNIILSPFTIYNVLAIISEGAHGITKEEIYHAIRGNTYQNFSQWAHLNTDSIQLIKINSIFVDKNHLPLEEYQIIAKEKYETDVVSLDFSDNFKIADALNRVIANVTRGLIKNIVEPDYFQNTNMVLSSALYFKGQWSVPFNASRTVMQPFYNSYGEKIGEVNMMSNRFPYAFTNFRELQARVVELPYGENYKVSMYIILPNPGVTVERIFRNFVHNLDYNTFFEEMKKSKEEYPEDEVDLMLPRFNIENDLDLMDLLKERFGINDLFDPRKALLPFIARSPLYVSNIVHKAHIEVTERGTTAAGVSVAEFKQRIGATPFVINRPFVYIIAEKVTNTIILGGFYRQPVLY